MTIVCGAINVKDSPYNAYGDGSHNDRDAIQDAIDAAAIAWGGENLRIAVCLPAGAYRCDSGLTIPYGLSLVGHPGGTVLDFSNASSSVIALQWGTSALDVSHGGISGLTMYGPGGSSVGVRAGDESSSGSKKISNSAIRDCFIRGFGTGIELGSQCFVIQFEHLRIGYNGIGVATTPDPQIFGENMLFESCAFDENDTHFNISPGSAGEGVTFRNCTFSFANTPPEGILARGTTIFFDTCTWDSDQAGTSGNPLLVEIAAPIGAIVFRDVLFRLNQPSGIPICWNNSGSGPSCRITFDSCVVSNLGSSTYFYDSKSGSSTPPNAVSIQSPSVTAASANLTPVDP